MITNINEFKKLISNDITSNIKSIIKENLVDEIDADLKSKIIQIEKLKDIAHSIKVLCNGEYGDTFLDIENNKVLIVLGDSNPFDDSLKYFILDAIAEYDNQDKISIELENEIQPDNEFKYKYDLKQNKFIIRK